MTYGERLRTARGYRRMNRKEMGEFFDMNPVSIINYENDKFIPPLKIQLWVDEQLDELLDVLLKWKGLRAIKAK